MVSDEVDRGEPDRGWRENWVNQRNMSESDRENSVRRKTVATTSTWSKTPTDTRGHHSPLVTGRTTGLPLEFSMVRLEASGQR